MTSTPDEDLGVSVAPEVDDRLIGAHDLALAA